MEQGGARGEHSDRLIAEGVAAKSDRSPTALTTNFYGQFPARALQSRRLQSNRTNGARRCHPTRPPPASIQNDSGLSPGLAGRSAIA